MSRTFGSALPLPRKQPVGSSSTSPAPRRSSPRSALPGSQRTCGMHPPTSLPVQGVRHVLAVAAKKQQAENSAPVATNPQALLVRQRFCEHCSEKELTLAASEVTRQLLEELAGRTGRTIL